MLQALVLVIENAELEARSHFLDKIYKALMVPGFFGTKSTAGKQLALRYASLIALYIGDESKDLQTKARSYLLSIVQNARGMLRLLLLSFSLLSSSR